MKILKIDRKKNSFLVVAQDIDDLWVLSTIIDVGDKAKALSERKIKIGNSDDRKTKIVKKKVMLELIVEKVQFHKYTTNLRISGKILEGQEDISSGSYHTLDIEPDTKLSIVKKKLYSYQVQKLEEHSKKKDKIIICTLDRETAKFYNLLSFGIEKIGEINGDVQKKDLVENKKSDFFKEIIIFLDEQLKNNGYDKIIIASAPFWQKYLTEILKSFSKLKSKTIFAEISSVGENGIKEILSSTKLSSIIKDIRNSKDLNLINELLKNIKNGSKATYGIKDTTLTINNANIKTLLITQKFIKQKRENENFEEIENIMNLTEQLNGEICVINSNSEAGEILDGLGGIASLSRY